MAERKHRAVRMGIDVGGTYTKCVAMDNETHEIIGKNEVKTTPTFATSPSIKALVA